MYEVVVGAAWKQIQPLELSLVEDHVTVTEQSDEKCWERRTGEAIGVTTGFGGGRQVQIIVRQNFKRKKYFLLYMFLIFFFN